MENDIFVERKFKIKKGDDRECILRFYAPTPAVVDYECKFAINGLGRDMCFTVVGVDAIQALLLAIELARYEINAYLEDHGLVAEIFGESASDVLPELGENGEFSIRVR